VAAGGARAAGRARAQQGERVRRIAVLMSTRPDDSEGQARLAAFLQGLQQWGWTVGSNIRLDARWAAGNPDEIRKHATELVALTPEVILASGGTVVGPLLQAIRTVPVVFTLTPDPVAAGIVDSLGRPGGNATGFTTFDYSIAAKWLELLKQIAPSLTRAMVLRDPTIPEGVAQFAVFNPSRRHLGWS
jgi:putative tryptophan/tyrosine transport system substrate-binding protein